MKNVERFVMVLGMLIFLLSPFLLSPFSIYEAIQYPQNRQIIFSKITINFILAGIFYLNLRVLTPRLLEQKNVGAFILILMGLLLGFIVFDAAFMHYIDPHLQPPPNESRLPGPPGPPPRRPNFAGTGLIPQIAGNLIMFLFMVLSSSMIVLLRERIREKDLRQQILYEKVKAELSVLKLQVSPHFLFNTLNNIRYLARKKSDKTEEAVVELAQLLRYMIYQVNDDVVPLSKEIDHLNRYINLQKMRLQGHTNVNFNYSGDFHQRNIEPLLFIPFVENAFKYGVHAHKPSLLLINISVTEKELVFQCENDSFIENAVTDTASSGVGIANAKKRLQLYYPHSHQLNIEEINGMYRVVLRLQFNHE